MGVLEELGGYLVTNMGLVLGTNLFLSDLPDQPDSCVALLEAPGPPPQDFFGSATLPGYEMPHVQVLSRDPGYANAKANATLAWDWFTKLNNTTLGAVSYLRAHPLQSPFNGGRDPALRSIIVFNVEVTKVPV